MEKFGLADYESVKMTEQEMTEVTGGWSWDQVFHAVMGGNCGVYGAAYWAAQLLKD